MTKPSVSDHLAVLREAELPPGEEEAILARILQSPRTPLPGDFVGDERPSHVRRTALLAGAGTVAVAAGFAGVALAVSGSGASRSDAPTSGLRLASPGRPTGSTVHARLLSALTNANGDVIETTITFASGWVQHDWSNGTSSRMVNTAPNAWPPERLTTVSSSTTTLTGIYPATKTWTTLTKPTVQGISESAAEQIYAETGRDPFGPLTLVAKGVTVDGQLTNEYARPYDDGDLWVNATTYLPVRVESNVGQTDWTYYAPTPAALAELTMSIPAGYTEVSLPAGATGLPHTLPLPTTSPSSPAPATPTTPAPTSSPTPTSAPTSTTTPTPTTPAPTSGNSGTTATPPASGTTPAPTTPTA